MRRRKSPRREYTVHCETHPKLEFRLEKTPKEATNSPSDFQCPYTIVEDENLSCSLKEEEKDRRCHIYDLIKAFQSTPFPVPGKYLIV